MFCLVLGAVDDNDLMSAENQGVDSTHVKANASMRNICRKEGGQTYSEYTTALAKAADETVDDDKEDPRLQHQKMKAKKHKKRNQI